MHMSKATALFVVTLLPSLSVYMLDVNISTDILHRTHNAFMTTPALCWSSDTGSYKFLCMHSLEQYKSVLM